LRLLWPAMAALLTLALQGLGVLTSAELLVRDALLRTLPAKPAPVVAVVLIDDAALRRSGPWPWDRAQLAHLVDRVAEAGAKGVVLDLLLPESRGGDDALAMALGRLPSALAVGLDEQGAWVLPTQRLRGAALGHVSFDLDGDGVVRRFSATKQLGGTVLPALPLAAAQLRDAQLPTPVGQVLRPSFRSSPLPTLSAVALLDTRDLAPLRSRVVFIGTSAAGVGDRFVSPVSRGGSPDPGVLIEALSTQAILSGELLQRAPLLVNALLAMALGWLGILLLSGSSRRLPLLAAGLVFAPLLATAAALQFLYLELAPVAVFLSLLVVGTLMAAHRTHQARLAMGAASSRILELEGLQAVLAEAHVQDAEARRVVAHELKTPLTSVKGLAQLLARFDLSGPERTRVANLVVSETSRLTQMVDALLDLERLRLRDFDRDARSLDVSALVATRVEVLRAGTKRMIQANLGPDLRAMGDQALLDRVLENLVSNAIKFSPEGSPIRISLAGTDAAIELEVEDRGPGIPDAERKKVFGRFARGSTQGLAPGLGLGLALVTEVVTWHRGTVEVEEGATGGSLFRVRLPSTLHSAH